MERSAIYSLAAHAGGREIKSRILIPTLAAIPSSALILSDIKIARAVFSVCDIDPDNCKYNTLGRLTYPFAGSSQPGREQQTSGGGHRKTSSGDGHKKTQKRKHVDADQSPIELRRSLFSGSESTLFDFGWLRGGYIIPLPEVRVITAPEKGAIRFEQISTAVATNSTELQKLCHGKQVEALRLLYKAPDDFTGTDKFVLNVDTKVGYVRRYVFTVNAAGASAQASKVEAVSTVTETSINRDVFAGNEARIAAMNSVHSDCSPGPVPAPRMVTAPKIGEYRLEEITIALDRRADDERAKCNGAPVRALGVFYK
jgi:hypothetical protein